MSATYLECQKHDDSLGRDINGVSIVLVIGNKYRFSVPAATLSSVGSKTVYALAPSQVEKIKQKIECGEFEIISHEAVGFS